MFSRYLMKVITIAYNTTESTQMRQRSQHNSLEYIQQRGIHTRTCLHTDETILVTKLYTHNAITTDPY